MPGGVELCVDDVAAEPDGLIDAEAFQIHLVAEHVSVAWLAFAGATVPVQAANDAGVALPAKVWRKSVSVGTLVISVTDPDEFIAVCTAK